MPNSDLLPSLLALEAAIKKGIVSGPYAGSLEEPTFSTESAKKRSFGHSQVFLTRVLNSAHCEFITDK